MSNIRCKNNAFPDFGKLSVNEISAEKVKLISEIDKDISYLKSGKISDGFSSFEYLDTIFFKISSLLNPLYLMGSTHPNQEIRKISDDIVSELSKLEHNILLDEEIYIVLKNSVKKIRRVLTKEEEKLKNDLLRSYERNGFHLQREQRELLKKLQYELSDLSIEFNNNIAEAEDFILLEENENQGLPADFLASRKFENKYKITLDYPDYVPFMKYSGNEEKRKELYIKNLNKAKEKNVAVLDKILKKRQDLADLLSFSSYADYILEERMAKSSENVWAFTEELKKKVRKKADNDFNELLDYFSLKKIQAWSKSYYITKFLKEKYKIDPEEIKSYFSLENSLAGIFQICETLFDITINQNSKISCWHEDVGTYDVFEEKKLIARFYLDLHPRKDKYGHAACFGILSGKELENGYRLPAAALVCNFPKASKDTPSLLYHDDLITLFHEFGHLLHQILTQARYSISSGTSVVRDFVETPSQMFENWAWNYESLSSFAKHYQTGEILPKVIYDRMIKAKNVGSGIDTEQQLFYAAIDMTLHDKYKEMKNRSISDCIKDLQNNLTRFKFVDDTHFEASFGHLDGYAAGYYGYLWSKVYAEDFFSLFEEKGIFNKELGKKLQNQILSMGGSIDENELVENYLGRKANETAFLKSIGLE
jgi:thimet oligopeptidase